MRTLQATAFVLAAFASAAFATDIPVPSFNDTPELYAHPKPPVTAPRADVGSGASSTPAPQGPGVTPSSGP